eukprot:351955-Chlamydomonas_euryale.AAC.18
MAVAFLGPEGRGGGGGSKGGFPRLAIDVAPSAPTGGGGTRPPSAGHPHGPNHGWVRALAAAARPSRRAGRHMLWVQRGFGGPRVVVRGLRACLGDGKAGGMDSG